MLEISLWCYNICHRADTVIINNDDAMQDIFRVGCKVCHTSTPMRKLKAVGDTVYKTIPFRALHPQIVIYMKKIS